MERNNMATENANPNLGKSKKKKQTLQRILKIADEIHLRDMRRSTTASDEQDLKEKREAESLEMRLVDQIYAVFTAAEAERYPEALEAANRRPRFDSLDSDSGSESD